MLYKYLALLCFWLVNECVASEILLRPEPIAHPLLKKRIQSWIQELGQESEPPAGQYLRKIGPIAIPQLLEALQSKNPVVQRRVLEIISGFQIPAPTLPKILPALTKIVDDESADPRVREAAALALGNCGTVEVLEFLLRYTDSHDARIQRGAIQAILKNTHRGAIPYWIKLLKHWNTEVRTMAYRQLVQRTKQTKLPLTYEAWNQWWTEEQDRWEEF